MNRVCFLILLGLFHAITPCSATDMDAQEPKVLTVRDDLSQPAWRMLSGNGEQGVAEADYVDGALSLVGSCMQQIALDDFGAADFSGQVDFFLADAPHQTWESASLALFGATGDLHGCFMVIFGQPGNAKGRCQLGLYPEQMIYNTLTLGEWHTIKVESTYGDFRMKVWARDSAEPHGWDVEGSIPLQKVTGVGMRTFGPAVKYDRFAFTAEQHAPLTLSRRGFEMEYRPTGTLRSLNLPDGKEEAIQFRQGGYLAGPAWVSSGKQVRLRQNAQDPWRFTGVQADIHYSIEYKTEKDRLIIVASLENRSGKVLEPDAARFMLGIDTEMIKHPEWNHRLFPTLIRGEKTHLWGYFQSPHGRVIALSSADPIASWNYEYQPREHRIHTVSLDMLHRLPLPERHPQNMTQLRPGEEKSWTLFLDEVDSVDHVKPAVSKTTNAPMIDIDRYTLAAGEQAFVTIHSSEGVALTITDPAGVATQIVPKKGGADNVFEYVLKPAGGIGQYDLVAENKNGYVTGASIYVRHPWSWYLKQARKEAIRCPQKASGCCESWLGHFSTTLAKRYFPDAELDAQAEKHFRTILPVLYDLDTGSQIHMSARIQNSYYMISLLTDAYRATGKMEDLELSSRIADWLITHQTPDGAYRNGHTHYTAVAYGTKSLLELIAVEKELAETSQEWRQRYERHLASVKLAVNDLKRSLDNIQTEGQMTYEDGMIGCSATQLALWALVTDDREERARFTKAARYMFDGHACLDQRIVPDSRYNEGSLRFWEAQYDVLIPANMMNSPHGWTAWRIPGYCYMYQLTGEEEWLRRAMNSLGSCVQLIDGKTGLLRWSFAQDPYIEAPVYRRNPRGSGGVYATEVISEQYIDMISDFHQPTDFGKAIFGYSTQDGSSCDNDVHEIFKALEEVALTAAYVIERDDGSLSTYNCVATRTNGTITITPSEAVVSRLHLNLKNTLRVTADFASGAEVSGSYSGMQWVGPGGVPEDLR